MQYGKGRDTSLPLITIFEGKLSKGAGMQALSRDVERVCASLEWPRLLTFYYGGIGHYTGSLLTMAAVQLMVHIMAVSALFHMEQVGGSFLDSETTMQVIQLLGCAYHNKHLYDACLVFHAGPRD